ncbi:putative bifunctional diguanylate cyclase/phosphodiesterase [Persephonella sp.]
MRSLKGIILTFIIIGATVVYSYIYFAVSNMYLEHIKKRAYEESHILAKQTFNSMFQIMKRGWSREDLEKFLEANQEAFEESLYTVDIYRGKIVEQLFGKVDQKEMDEHIKSSFITGEDEVVEQGGILRLIHPLKATNICLTCHINAKEGDVLGVIEVRQNLRQFVESAKKDFLLSLVAVFPIPIIIAVFIAFLINKKIKEHIDKLNEKIGEINSISDLSRVELHIEDIGIKELNIVYTGVQNLIDRMKHVAVDKDMLEFEIKLLEKFVITSAAIKDWRDYINQMLIEVNKIIPVYSAFFMFQSEENSYDIEIFWVFEPSQAMKKDFENLITSRMEECIQFKKGTKIDIRHNVIDRKRCIPKYLNKKIKYRKRCLMLDNPGIGSAVGIGILPEVLNDKTKVLIIDSMLSTFLNLITSVKAINKYSKEIEYYSTRDSTTGLYNQKVFWELLGYEIARADRHGYEFTLLTIDIDNFKAINDIYGYGFGDIILQKIGQIIRDTIRRGDIIARYGGDEFAVILPLTDSEKGYRIAKDIIDNINRFFLIATDGSKIKVSVSIGMAVYPDHGKDAKDLFLFAENMLYKVKMENKGSVLLPSKEDIEQIYKKIGKINITILNAIETKKIIPYFQPILDIEENQVYIHEVLCRMNSDNKLLRAEEFISIAEKMGIIHKLDLVLMENTFEKVKEENYDGILFLNISPKAIISKEFIKNVKSLVSQYKLSPSKIVFEITERETVSNISVLEDFVFQLKEEGFKFAIDDFGSGFSSFHYIKRFPIDIVKIEGDFIRSMVKNPKDKAFVLSITTLTKNLGIKTVAEYVENDVILEAVKSAGIDYAQGYYVGKPSPHFYRK